MVTCSTIMIHSSIYGNAKTNHCRFYQAKNMHSAPGNASDQWVSNVSQSGTRWPVVLSTEGDLMLLGIPWMLASESCRCLCQLQCDWWKVALVAEIPVNWQRGFGLAPLFPPILEWSVCQGDTLGLASMHCLFPQLSGPGGIGGFKTSRFYFQNCLCAPIQKKEMNHLGVV